MTADPFNAPSCDELEDGTVDGGADAVAVAFSAFGRSHNGQLGDGREPSHWVDTGLANGLRRGDFSVH